MVNSAKHSGTGWLSVYSEIDDSTAEVWVTDQGAGFSTESIAADRKGIDESIIGRMHRHGGTAEINSKVGEGTEVHLVMPGVRVERSGE
jgi:signal transduction histidine kinase